MSKLQGDGIQATEPGLGGLRTRARWRTPEAWFVLALLLAVGCGSSGGSGGGTSGAGGEATTSSMGHALNVRNDLGDAPVTLGGLQLEGDVFITIEPTTGLQQVEFFLNDPNLTGEPFQYEQNPPFDFAGGTSASPDAWDTTTLPDGNHTISARLWMPDGSIEVIEAPFVTQNDIRSVVTNKSSVAFSFEEGQVGTDSDVATLSLSDGTSSPYTVSGDGSTWLDVVQGSATLPSDLSFHVDSQSLAEGTHTSMVTVQSANAAAAQITITLTITEAGTPAPGADLAFSASSIVHNFTLDDPGTDSTTVQLSATGGATSPYTLTHTPASWMTVSPMSGSLPGNITVSVDSNGLAPGVHQATVTASVSGLADATMIVRVSVSSGADTVASSVSRHGITWFFDDEYEVGQFVNGDWYVIGPVMITHTTPTWTGTYDGSMINPSYDDDQGYDSRTSFDGSLRVGTTNLVLQPGESLVTADSWRNGESGAPSSNNSVGIPRPALKTAAVLTCLATPPPDGAFRPPYGGDAKPMHNVSELRPWLLPQLPKPSSTPSLSVMEQRYERLWLDHISKWKNRYMHPEDNMEDYSRNIASEFNTGSLMLMCNFTQAEKETLMIRLVQIGIDQFGILQTGATYGDGGGGIGSGRKWPILLAGILLNDGPMMSIGYSEPVVTALEDCQTFYLTAGDLANYPGDSVGEPVWGERHCTGYPSGYDDPGNTGYRTCCTANAWVGAVLSVHILTGETAIDVKSLWNHPPLFDYQDKYMADRPVGDWTRSWSGFQEDMWDMYRDDYGPVYVEP